MLITAFIIFLTSILIYLLGVSVLFLLKEPKEKINSPPKRLNPFSSPIFKIPIGLLIIIGTIIYSIRFVKFLPPIMKIGIIGLDFIIIYTVINYLFINKKQKNNN